MGRELKLGLGFAVGLWGTRCVVGWGEGLRIDILDEGEGSWRRFVVRSVGIFGV